MAEVKTPADLLARLRKNLLDYFSEEELRSLCFDLSVNYDSLPAQGTEGKSRELVVYLDHRGAISKLIKIARNLRPQLDWGISPDSVSTTSTESRKIWIVHEGQTLDWIAYREYGDPAHWRHIAETNNLANPLDLQPGQVLKLVPLP